MANSAYALKCKTKIDTQQMKLLLAYLFELDIRAFIIIVQKYGVAE